MSLIITFHNVGSDHGSPTAGQETVETHTHSETYTYTVEVLVGDGTRYGSRTLWTDRVTGFDRREPWWELIIALLKKMGKV